MWPDPSPLLSPDVDMSTIVDTCCSGFYYWGGGGFRSGGWTVDGDYCRLLLLRWMQRRLPVTGRDLF